MVKFMISRDYFTLFVAMVTFIQKIHGEAACSPGWTLDSRKGRCIRIMEPKLDYDTARIVCKRCGAELLRMEDDLDQQFLINMNQNDDKTRYLFIGMNDREKMGEWRYENGDLVTWFEWGYKKQDGSLNDPQHCILLGAGYSMLMRDHYCASRNGYICMKPAGESKPTSATFQLQSVNCLENHSIVANVPSIDIEDCVSVCAGDVCCQSVSYGNRECVLYMPELASVPQVCVCAGCRLFTKK